MKNTSVTASIDSVLLFVRLVQVQFAIHLLLQDAELLVVDSINVYALPVAFVTTWERVQQVCLLRLAQSDSVLAAHTDEVGEEDLVVIVLLCGHSQTFYELGPLFTKL